jgi:hypothetical protein
MKSEWDAPVPIRFVIRRLRLGAAWDQRRRLRQNKKAASQVFARPFIRDRVLT